MKDKLFSILDKMVDFEYECGYNYIDFYYLSDALEVIDLYEANDVLMYGGQILRLVDKKWDFYSFYSYTDKDISKSAELARKVVKKLKKETNAHSKVIIELGGMYNGSMLTHYLDGVNFVKSNGVVEFITYTNYLSEVKKKNETLFRKIRRGFTKIENKDGYYWEYKHALKVVDVYEKYGIIVRGGVPIEIASGHLLERYDGYWEYSGKDVRESAEIARKMIAEMEDTDNVYIELGEPYKSGI